MATKYYCDRCNSEITNYIWVNKIELKINTPDNDELGNRYSKDYCQACKSNLIEFINRKKT